MFSVLLRSTVGTSALVDLSASALITNLLVLVICAGRDAKTALHDLKLVRGAAAVRDKLADLSMVVCILVLLLDTGQKGSAQDAFTCCG